MNNILSKIEEFVIFFSIISTTILIAINVIMRNFAKMPLSWPDEIGRYALILIIFFGYIIAVRKNMEIKIDIFLLLFPKQSKLFHIVGNFASLLFSVILVGSGFQYMLLKYRLQTKTVILEIPEWLLALIFLVLCGSLLFYRYILKLFIPKING